MSIGTRFLPPNVEPDIPAFLKNLLQRPDAMNGAGGPPTPDFSAIPLSPEQQQMVQAPQPQGQLASVLNAPVGQPTLPHETKGHKLLSILMGGFEGAAAGFGQPNFAAGYQSAEQMQARQLG